MGITTHPPDSAREHIDTKNKNRIESQRNAKNTAQCIKVLTAFPCAVRRTLPTGLGPQGVPRGTRVAATAGVSQCPFWDLSGHNQTRPGQRPRRRRSARAAGPYSRLPNPSHGLGRKAKLCARAFWLVPESRHGRPGALSVNAAHGILVPTRRDGNPKGAWATESVVRLCEKLRGWHLYISLCDLPPILASITPDIKSHNIQTQLSS